MRRRFAQASGDFVRRRKLLPPDLAAKSFKAGSMGIIGSGGVITSIPSAPGLIPSGVSLPPADQLQSQFEKDRQSYLKQMTYDLDVLRQIQTIGRTIIPRIVSVTTTAIQLFKASDPKGVIILNPSATAGLTNTGSLFASLLRTVAAPGPTYFSTAVGVANYDRMILFLDISATVLTPAVKVDVQSQDPVSGNWATAQVDIFAAPTAVGTYYANIGNLGVDSNLRLKVTLAAGTSSTFSVGYILKDGLPGSTSGTSRTIFMGNSGVNATSGFDLLEGQRYPFYFLQNAELWAISNISTGVSIKLFELS